MKEKNISARIVAVEFLLILLIPLITFNWKKDKLSVIENRYLAPMPVLFIENVGLNRAFISEGSAWFQDNLGMRDSLMTLANKIKLDLLHKSSSPKVQLGSDDWLYFDSEYNMETVSGNYPGFDEAGLEEICRQQVLINDKLLMQGVGYVLAIPPSKPAVYPEYVKSGSYTLGPTPADVLADYLENTGVIKVSRLKDVLVQEKMLTDTSLYFKTDTHWNPKGAYIGYTKMIEDMVAWSLMDTNPAEVQFVASPSPQLGDLSVMLGNTADRYKENFECYQIVNANGMEITEGVIYDEFQVLLTDMKCRSGRLFTNASVEGPRVLLYGDSMAGTMMLPLFAENCSEFAFVWNYSLDQRMIDWFKPDIVIVEVTERYLHYLSEKEKKFLGE